MKYRKFLRAVLTTLVVVVLGGITGTTVAVGATGESMLSPITNSYRFVPIQFPGALVTIVSAVNNAGDVAGWFEDTVCYEDCLHGFVIIAGQMRQLDVVDPTSPTHNTRALEINDAGEVVGVYGNNSEIFGVLPGTQAATRSPFLTSSIR